MSATKFALGKGAVLSISVDGGTTFTPIKQLKSITYPSSKADFDDITNMDSEGAYHEYVPTMLDAGTVDFQGVWAETDPGQVAASAAFDAQTLAMFKHQFARRAGEGAGFLRTFNAYMASKPSIDAQFDKASTYTGSLKVTGGYTDAAPSAIPAGYTGATTSASTSVTGVTGGTGTIVAGLNVAGAGIPAGATVVSFASGTLVLSIAATATASGVALTFS